MYGLTLLQPPAAEPLTLDQAKRAARVDPAFAAEDEFFTVLIQAARYYAETHTHRQLMPARWLLTLDGFPWGYMRGAHPWGEIRVPWPPLVAVNAINYNEGSDGALVTLDPSLYFVDPRTEPGRITPAFGKVWPVPRYEYAALQVDYNAGHTGTDQTTANPIPACVLLGMRLLVSHWYDNRDAIGQELKAANDLFLQAWTGEDVDPIGGRNRGSWRTRRGF